MLYSKTYYNVQILENKKNVVSKIEMMENKNKRE